MIRGRRCRRRSRELLMSVSGCYSKRPVALVNEIEAKAGQSREQTSRQLGPDIVVMEHHVAELPLSVLSSLSHEQWRNTLQACFRNCTGWSRSFSVRIPPRGVFPA